MLSRETQQTCFSDLPMAMNARRIENRLVKNGCSATPVFEVRGASCRGSQLERRPKRALSVVPCPPAASQNQDMPKLGIRLFVFGLYPRNTAAG